MSETPTPKLKGKLKKVEVVEPEPVQEEVPAPAEEVAEPEKKRGRKKAEEPEISNVDKQLSEREEKRKTLAAALTKKFGAGAITIAADAEYRSVTRLSSGLLVLDWAIGGGWASGRCNLLAGEPSTCKSRILYGTMGEAQRRSVVNNKFLFEDMPEKERVPYRCLLVDVEGSFTPEWGAKCGIDPSLLEIARPQTQEEAADIITAAVGSGAYDLIGVDAIDGMVPEDDIEASIDEASFGAQAAKNNNKIFRKIQSMLNKYAKDGALLPTVLFLNQLKPKIGGMGHGPKKTMSGGTGQNYYSSIIVELGAGAIEYFDTERQQPKYGKYYGLVRKNKVSTPGVNFEFLMALSDDPKGQYLQAQFGESSQVYDFAVRTGIVEEVQEGSKKYWKCFGKEYDRKLELSQEWFVDADNFRLLKRAILKILCPRQ